MYICTNSNAVTVKIDIGQCGQNLKCGIQEHLQALKSNYITL